MSNPARLYLRSLESVKSRTTMESYLARGIGLIAEGSTIDTYDWSSFRYQDLDELKALLNAEKKSPSTINTIISAFKGVAKHARRLGLIDVEDLQNIREVKSSRGSRSSKGRTLELSELNEMIDSCMVKEGPINMRDAAIIALVYGAGLRRSEAAAITLSSYSRENSEVTIIGKGNKERVNPINDRVVDIIECWLDERGRHPGPLFVRVYKGGKVTRDPITDQTVYDVLVKRYKESGLKRLTPHDLRRAYATNLLESGEDVLVVQDLMGHESLDTTKIYDKRGKKGKVKAGKALPL